MNYREILVRMAHRVGECGFDWNMTQGTSNDNRNKLRRLVGRWYGFQRYADTPETTADFVVSGRFAGWERLSLKIFSLFDEIDGVIRFQKALGDVPYAGHDDIAFDPERDDSSRRSNAIARLAIDIGAAMEKMEILIHLFDTDARYSPERAEQIGRHISEFKELKPRWLDMIMEGDSVDFSENFKYQSEVDRLEALADRIVVVIGRAERGILEI